MKNLIIISNERVSKDTQGKFKSINLDLQILPDELSKYYNLKYVCRSSSKQENHEYKITNVFPCSNLISFLYEIIKSLFTKNNYLMVSISPYIFFSFLVLFIFRKKNIFTYLMSNGYEEYKHILGNKAVFIYDIMFKFITKFSKVIVCHKRLFDPKKSFYVSPSRLGEIWFKNISTPNLEIPRYLYVGRINPEKGIENFIDIIEPIKQKLTLSIAGNTDKLKKKNLNIHPLGYLSSEKELIDAYDTSNISILPSFTEAHPYVLEESLARKRPIVIFEDISYVKKNKIGVFVIKRNREALVEITKYILQNYIEIQNSMEKNKLPTKSEMIKNFCEIIG